jgi:hypothetical protein
MLQLELERSRIVYYILCEYTDTFDHIQVKIAAMSHDSRPISPSRFLEAITDLPVGNLYAKAAEIQNSIAHLERSNADLAEFQDDPDCKQALTENLETIRRMQERIDMLKREVTGRGLRWVEGDGYKEGVLEPGEEVTTVNGTGGLAGANGTARANGAGSSAAARTNAPSAPSGTLTDEQLRRLLSERLDEPGGDDEEEGVHL